MRAELATMNAGDTAALIPGATSRALGSMPPSVLPYSNGRTLMVGITLVPTTLRVPTELGLRFVVSVGDANALSIGSRPARADLVIAAQLALDGELRALEVAAAALERTGEKPPGPSWAAALRTARLDPRLPAEQFPGERSWHLMFEPWNESGGGWRSVLLGLPRFDVQMVNGKRP